MADPVWVDGTTPLNSVNMTKLQTRDEKNVPSGYVGLDASSKIVLTDANLYRVAADVLATDDTFRVIGANGIQFGSSADTNLYRSSGSLLATDDSFTAGGFVRAGTGAAYQMYMGMAGPGNEAGILFGSASDTNLYRAAAGVVKTDGILNAVGGLQVNGVPVGGGATVATTVAGLGTPVEGKVGRIRVGTVGAGYAYLDVIYDATRGGWVSDEITVWSTPSSYTAVQASTNGAAQAMGYFAIHDFDTFLAAGLRPQFRWVGMTTCTYGALNGGFYLTHTMLSHSFVGGIEDPTAIGRSIDIRGYYGAGWAGFDIGWNPLATVPGSPKAILVSNLYIQPDNSGTSHVVNHIGTVYLRWVSA